MRYIVLLLLVGCGVANGPSVPTDLTGRVLEADIPECGHVSSTVPFELNAYVRLLAKAQQDAAVIIPAGEFCPLMQSVPVHLQPDQLCLDGNCDWTSGLYSPFGGIWMASRRTLLHEIFHAWDWFHLAWGTLWHQDWEWNGYYDADLRYRLWVDAEHVTLL